MLKRGEDKKICTWVKIHQALVCVIESSEWGTHLRGEDCLPTNLVPLEHGDLEEYLQS